MSSQRRAESGPGTRSPTSTLPTSAAEKLTSCPNWSWDIPAATPAPAQFRAEECEQARARIEIS
jgi:hypothetical protein